MDRLESIDAMLSQLEILEELIEDLPEASKVKYSKVWDITEYSLIKDATIVALLIQQGEEGFNHFNVLNN